MSSLLEKPIIIEMGARGPQGRPGELYFPAIYFDFTDGHMYIKGLTGHYDPEFILNYDNGHLEVVLP
jgi:hypothetical protein